MVVVSTSTTIDPSYIYNSINDIMLNPKLLFVVIVIILIIVLVSSASLEGQSEETEKKSSVIGIVIIIILVILISANAFQYFLNINIVTYLHNFLNPDKHDKEIDIVVNKETPPLPNNVPTPNNSVPEIKTKKQVYNIPGNYYTYNDARAICQAYGSELANYQQIEKAYEKGGEWCNSGWSEGQMALYPTQQKTYDSLQEIEGHEHDCGRPGINGGYIANQNVLFGVNCYGYKPKITEEEEELMKTAPQYPETTKDLLFQKKVDYWKQHVNELLVSPFNHDNWSES